MDGRTDVREVEMTSQAREIQKRRLRQEYLAHGIKGVRRPLGHARAISEEEA